MKKLEFPKCDNNKISHFQPPKFLFPKFFLAKIKQKNERSQQIRPKPQQNKRTTIG
jgi:hypothetical protein